jgi:phosphoribosylamine--glycine ligase
VFGASQRAARIESSKAFAKDVMRAARVATARAEHFETEAPARAALDRLGPPWVIKADGLAAGKGVCVTGERDEAERFLVAALEEGRFGEAGRRVLIEEFLPGEEVSVMAVCDGGRYALLPAARDYKRALDGEQGPNTGGMGAWAPVPLDPALERRIGEEIIQPVLDEMARSAAPFRGLLYAGLMIEGGRASVVEFNARFGDPETEAVVPIRGGSLGELLRGAATGTLDPKGVELKPGATVAVALVDARYPEPGGGGVIEGLERLEGRPDVWVFHAGTVREQDHWRVRGGRAAYVVAAAANRESARALAYEAVATLGGTGWRVRSDIGAPSGARDEAEVRRGAGG